MDALWEGEERLRDGLGIQGADLHFLEMRRLLALRLFLKIRRWLALRFLLAMRRCLAEEPLGKECGGTAGVRFGHIAL